MKSTIKKTAAVLLLSGAALATTACKDFLDVNTNPNGPETVTANLYLPPMLHWMATGPQFDGRFIGRYTQQWFFATSFLTTWDRMGYDPSSDNGAWLWRNVYWNFGQNLVDMMAKAEAEERWDLLGVGYILKAWGWQVLTDVHGEIIVKEAIDPSKFAFNYDSQEYAYEEVRNLLNKAIENLSRTDGAVDQAYLAKGDKIYNGDRTKWLKFAYGMLARNLSHYTNKPSLYKPAEVIAAVDKSFTSNADDALFDYPATSADNSDRNFWGPTRGNINSYRQTRFVVGLMNGSVFGAVDPRMSRMLAPAPDSQYRGLDVNVAGFGALPVSQRPNNFFGYPGTAGFGLPGRYLFADQAKLPIMTYAELQFIKAEAAYRMGNKALALDAYVKALSAHIDFVNARNQDDGQTPRQITAAEKAAFLADPRVVPANLTLTHIMSQKYIALWAWGHVELWTDMRRYHYTDIDPASGLQVYPGFTPPTNLYVDNAGKVVQRIRPRYNSEYVWNIPALTAIGGLALDYHTKPMWITEP